MARTSWRGTVSTTAWGVAGWLFLAASGCGDAQHEGEGADQDGAPAGELDAPFVDGEGGADAKADDSPDVTDPADAAPDVGEGGGGVTLAPEDGPANFAVASQGWYRGDLHYHTDFSEDAKEQGGDPLAVCIDIADYYRHVDFVSAFSDAAGNALDFIAITDHRTDLAITDPAFSHEHLILLPGEEYGGSGHAGIWGIHRHISHEPQGDESQNERHNAAIAEAHAMGAVFSVNHPLQDNNWVWDTPDIDAIEVFNGPWASFYRGSSEDAVAEDAAGGVENPFIRDAAVHGGVGGNDKAVRFWQNHLTAGRHVAIVGGSDRHMLVPAGLPTTYVRRPDGEDFAELQGPALGVEGVLEGIRQGGTFVSRSPFGPQIDLVATAEDGAHFPLGAELPGPGAYSIDVRVSRATGGVVRLIAGPLRAPSEDGRYAAAPEIVWEAAISHPRARGTFVWTVPPEGGWLHAIVLEPLVVEPLIPALEEARMLFEQPRDGDALLVMAEALLPLADPVVLLQPWMCAPEQWQPQAPQCMTVDQGTLATFHLPDAIVRLLNVYYEDGAPSDYCMGAITSAFLARPALQ